MFNSVWYNMVSYLAFTQYEDRYVCPPVVEDKNKSSSTGQVPLQDPWWWCPFRQPGKPFRYYFNPRRYQGLSQILCEGRFVCGSKKQNLLLTLVATALPLYVFFTVFMPEYRDIIGGVTFLQTLTVAMTVVMYVSFFSSAFSDPGIVPRDEPNARYSNIEDGERIGATMRILVINGVQTKQKWCETCNIYRPPRSKHCVFCDNCVLRFDHHCNWLGNCIGLGNYRMYLILIYSGCLVNMFTIYIVFSILSARAVWQTGIITPLEENWMLYVFLMWDVFIFGGTLLLAIYHSTITYCNLTTNEHVRDYYKGQNPFDLGPRQNFKHVYCYPDLMTLPLSDGGSDNTLAEAQYYTLDGEPAPNNNFTRGRNPNINISGVD